MGSPASTRRLSRMERSRRRVPRAGVYRASPSAAGTTRRRSDRASEPSGQWNPEPSGDAAEVSSSPEAAGPRADGAPRWCDPPARRDEHLRRAFAAGPDAVDQPVHLGAVRGRSVKAPISTAATTLFWRWRSAPAAPDERGPPAIADHRLVRVSNIMASPEPL